MKALQVTPATESLKGHPGLADIFVLLCSGWPATRVAHTVTRKYGVLTTAAQLDEYLEQIPDELLFNNDILIRRTYRLADFEYGRPVHPSEVVIDVTGEMTQCLLLMRERIDAMNLAEITSKKPTDLLTRTLKTYFDLLGMYAARLVSVERAGEQSPGGADAEAEQITLKDILDGREDTATVSEVSVEELHGVRTRKAIEQVSRRQLPERASGD